MGFHPSRQEFVAGDHRGEVGPAGANHLHDVHGEEDQEADGHDEVDGPSRLVPAEGGGQHVDLCRPVDGQAGHHGQGPKPDDQGVGQALGTVVPALGRERLAPTEKQVVLCHGDGVFERVAVRQEVAPLTGAPGVEAVQQAVDSEQPTEGEVEGQATGQAALKTKTLIDGVREEVEPVPTHEADTETEWIPQIGPVDAQTAPDHDGQEGKVDPVHPPRPDEMFTNGHPFGRSRFFIHLRGLGDGGHAGLSLSRDAYR